MSDYTLRLRAAEQVLAEQGFASLQDAQAALDEERFTALMLAIAAREKKLTRKYAPREVVLGDGLLGGGATPPATKALLIVNVAVFIARYVFAQASDQLGTVRALFDTIFQPTSPAALSADHCWPLLTSCFMHLGVWHIATNGISLLVLGGLVERFYGPLRFLGIYLVSGVVGSVAMAFIQGPGVGASGAISGLVGVLAIIGLRRRRSGGIAAEIAWATARWTIIGSILFTLVDTNIGWSAHLAGALTGGLLALILPTQQQVLTGARARLIHALAIALVAGPLLLLLPLVPALAHAV